MEGLEDSAGRRFDDRVVEFETGNGTGRFGARVVSWTPSGGVSRDAVVQLQFDGPTIIEPTRGVLSHDWSVGEPGTARFTGFFIDYSDDAKTVLFRPDGPLPANVTIEYPGVLTNSERPSVVTSGPVTSRPKLDVVSPMPDTERVVLDVHLQARFSEAVRAGSFGQISINADGRPIEAAPRLALDGRTLHLREGLSLPANALIEVHLRGLRDSAGNEIEGSSWRFRTASEYSPFNPVSAVLETQGGLAIRFSEPVNPLSLDRRSIELLVRSSYPGAAAASVDEGGTLLRLRPEGPLSEQYSHRLSVRLRSWTGKEISANFELPGSLANSVRDTDPPRVIGTIPADGQEVAVDTVAVLSYSELVRFPGPRSGVRLWIGEQEVRVSGGIGGPARSFGFAPESGWIPGQSYRVEVAGAVDLAGNEMKPFEFSFRKTGFAPLPLPFARVVSFSPARDAVGVAPDAAVETVFSQPVGLRSFPQTDGYIFVDPRANAPIDLGDVTIDGPTVRAKPITPLPAGRLVSARILVYDLYGQANENTLRYTTAAPSETDPPLVESIAPLPDNPLLAGPTEFTIRFSEPVERAPIRITAVSSELSGPTELPVSGRFTAGGDRRTIFVSATLPPSAEISVIVRDAVDLNGNTLQSAVTYTYRTQSAAASFAPQVVAVRPTEGGSLRPSTPVSVEFSLPMNAQSIVSQLRMHTSEGVEVTPTPNADGRIWTFAPPDSWPLNGGISLRIPGEIYSVSGLYINGTRDYTWGIFATAAQSAPRLVSYMAGPRAIDLLYDRAIDATALEEPFGLRLGHNRVDALIEQITTRWIRLRPANPLRTGQPYRLMLGPEAEMPLRWNPDSHADGPLRRPRLSAANSRVGRPGFESPVHPYWLATAHCSEGGQEVTPLIAVDREPGLIAWFETTSGRDRTVCRFSADE